ncbi:MAG: Rpn family recombination-promoting nuclease/putative transposase [Alphaproteobacteria bacterium]
MITKYLDPKNDVAFRKIFGTEKNKDILMHFLNDMAMFKDNPSIVDIEFLKTIQDPEIASKKTSIVDILCKDKSGRQYIVEMQVAHDKGFAERAQYYASKAYINQANVGDQYHNLREVVFLAITDFVMFPNRASFKSDHIILEKDTYDHDLKHLAFSFLELPKFTKTIHQLENITDKWMYFFKYCKKTSESDVAAIVGNDSIIERAYNELNRFNWSEIEMNTYEQEEKHERDHLSLMGSKYDEGWEKRGEKIARKLLDMGMSVEDVHKGTGLSIEKIKHLTSVTEGL